MKSWLPWWPAGAAPLLRSAISIPTQTPPSNETVPSTTTAYLTTDYSVPSKNTSRSITNYTSSTRASTKYPSNTTLDDEDYLSITTPKSPLDKKDKNWDSRPLGMIQTDLSKLPDCQRDCSKDLSDSLGLVLKDMSHVERYQQICSNYNESVHCVDKEKECEKEDRGMFDTFTAGFKYMCVDQSLAFNATIQCINDVAGVVQSECEDQCHTKTFFMNWIMRSTMQNTIQQGVNGIVDAATGGAGAGANGFSPDAFMAMLRGEGPVPKEVPTEQQLENFKQFTGGLCKIGDCILDCIRPKFNTRCEGSAGTLLSEVFVRPLAVGQDKMTLLRPVLGMFVPEQCSYLYSGADLAKHRIDSNMDTELRRMYSEKAEKEIREKAEADSAMSKLVPLGENGVPLNQFETRAASPLDASVKDLESLILELYPPNATDTEPYDFASGDLLDLLGASEANSTKETSGDVFEASADNVTLESSAAEASGISSSSNSSEMLESSAEDVVILESSGESSGLKMWPSPSESSNYSETEEVPVESSGLPLESSSEEVVTLESSGESSGLRLWPLSSEPSNSSETEDVSLETSGEASGLSSTSESSGDVEASGDESGLTLSSSTSSESPGDLENELECSGIRDIPSESSGYASGDVEASGVADDRVSGSSGVSPSSNSSEIRIILLESSGEIEEEASGSMSSSESSGDVEASGEESSGQTEVFGSGIESSGIESSGEGRRIVN
ncbi:unnamed protein product [Caenorhabditis auriculariae]|uniref:Chondroitin proteoglycan 4 domain-containing protein n=1 Tax=Caenorhabditis auriculariae TaxID=2777116 RepID=A0A8S1HMW8_9PELO|nr:unnamed protein product [Caenorhabditis auriculariae]